MSSVPGTVESERWRAPFTEQPPPERWIPPIPPRVIAAAALVIAVLAGRFFGDGRMGLGAALVLGVCYGPLAFIDLTIALAAYVAVLFIQDIAALSVGPNSMGVLVFLGWIGTLATRSARPVVLREQSRLFLVLALFALWLTLSIIWAQSSNNAANGVQTWLIAILALVVAVTTLHSPRDVTIIAVAFIVGATISVAFGIANGALSAAASSANEIALQGRFTGGGGDPNVQAAGFLVAMFLCAGLWSITRRRLARIGLLLAFVVVAIGFFATQSRGGFIALAVTAIVGLVALPRQRKRLLGLAAAAGAGLGVVAVVNPSAIGRMTDIGGGTSGRSDLWTVAWKIFTEHPLVGIGLNNFQVLQSRYTLKAGKLTRVDLIAETPHLVHNVYLQLLTETGVVGLAIFLVVIAGSLRASWLAARHFDSRAEPGYGDLARASLMASIAMLVTQFFISDGDDWRLWILLGLGPVLLSLARHMPPASPSAQSRPSSPVYVAWPGRSALIDADPYFSP
jgi:O-antigen ligase